MSILGLLTGHDAKESDVYADFSKVDAVVSEIEGISKNEVSEAKTAIHAALEELNNVNGLSTLVGYSVNISAFDDVFDNVSSSISEIATQLEEKANDVKEYENASWLERIGSTAAMALFKTGEGLLSPIEDLGDGVASFVGWVAGGLGNKDFQNACADFIKKDWARDTFSFYYDSAFAKKSAFTEDSLIANAFKVAGSTATYLYLGGAVARGGEAISSTLGSGVGRVAGGSGKIAKAAQAFQKTGNTITGFASSTTYANTAVAAMTGLGSGTEAGLQSGLSYNQAFGKGVVQGGIQGAVAFGAGKLSERAQQKANIKEAEKNLADAKETQAAAQEKVDRAQDTFDSAKADLEQKMAGRNDYNELKEEMINKGGYKNQVQKAAEAENAYRDQASKVDELIRNGATKEEIDAAIKETQTALEKMNLESDIVTHMEKSMEYAASNAPDISALEQAATKADTTFRSLETATAELNAANTAVQGAEAALQTATTTIPQGYTDVITQRGYNGDSMVGIGSDIVGAVAEHKVGTIAAAGINGVNAYVDHTGKAKEQFRKKNTINKKDLQPQDPIDNKGQGTITADTPIENKTDEDDPTNQTPTNTTTTNTTTTNTTPTNTTTTNTTTTNTTPTNTTPTDKTPTDKTPTDKTPTDKTPTDKTPTDTTPTDETPTDQTPTDQTPTDQTPTDQTPTDQTPTDTSSTTTFAPTGSSQTYTSGTYHSGGEYSGSDGYNTDIPEEGIEEEPIPVEDILDDSTTTADDIIRGNKYTKIPSSPTPLPQSPTTHKSTGNSIIPIAAGLSAAAAAGLGAKAYMDRKKNDEYDEEEDFDTEEWDEDADNLEIEYNDSSEKEEYLDEDDDYGYQAMENEKYGARSSQELADLQ